MNQHFDDNGEDLILIKNISTRTTIGQSHWVRPQGDQKEQPVLISVAVPHSLRLAGSSDHLPYSVHYGTLCKTIEKTCAVKGKYGCMEHLAEEIALVAFQQFAGIQEIRVKVTKPRALLHAKGVSISILRRRGGGDGGDVVTVDDLEISTIIGINPWEREAKQKVKINLSLEVPRWTKENLDGFNYQNVVDAVSQHVLESSYQTVESLITNVAHQALLSDPKGIQRVTARVGKPNALMFAESPEVQVTRTLDDFVSQNTNNTGAGEESALKHAVIAFGSNVGDRFANIEKALQTLEDGSETKIVDTSFLYETDAMYVEDQARFINGACAVKTSLSPQELLAHLKRVESEVGRTPTFRNGPRIVDLDIIFYDGLVYNHELAVDSAEHDMDLVIPHERLHEREFVLRPLNDIIPNFIHPKLHLTISQLLQNVVSSNSSPMRRAMPFLTLKDPSKESPYWTWGRKTHIMGIINTTPDSFSDGGDHLSIFSALEYAKASIGYVDILDVGGYSTRPGAAAISEEEEIARVVPVIKAIREVGITKPISIDTFRAGVAQAAIDAGANCINDVYGLEGEKDDRLLEVVKRTGVPVVVMHSRGDAGQNKGYDAYGGVVNGVRDELGKRMDRALKYGVRRWNLIADPGLGFSKTVEDHTTLLKDLRTVTAASSKAIMGTWSIGESLGITHALDGLPVLVGASRKSFLGKLVGRETAPKDRTVASAVAHAIAIQQGCDIIRAHDIIETWDTVKVADSVWRSS